MMRAQFDIHRRDAQKSTSLCASPHEKMKKFSSDEAPTVHKSVDPRQVTNGEILLPKAGARSPRGRMRASLHVHYHPRCSHSPVSLSAEFGEKMHQFAEFGKRSSRIGNRSITGRPDGAMGR
jgi:hypothetical protein